MVNNALKFHYVIINGWIDSMENVEFIAKKKKHFIAALKDNRLAA